MSPRWFNLEPKFWKLWPCLFFSTADNFANGPHFVALTQLRATKTGSKICCTHLSYTYSESWVRKDSVGTCPKKFPVQNFRVRRIPRIHRRQKRLFWAFFWKKKSFPGQNGRLSPMHALQILKAIVPEVNLSYQSSLLKHPTRRQNFANTVGTLCAHYLTLRPKNEFCRIVQPGFAQSLQWGGKIQITGQ